MKSSGIGGQAAVQVIDDVIVRPEERDRAVFLDHCLEFFKQCVGGILSVFDGKYHHYLVF